MLQEQFYNTDAAIPGSTYNFDFYFAHHDLYILSNIFEYGQNYVTVETNPITFS
jgi:hypothetical protein